MGNIKINFIVYKYFGKCRIMGLLTETMIVLFTVIMLGYYLNKINILDKKTNEKLSEIIVKVTSPMLIISSVLGNDGEMNKSYIIKVFISGIFLYTLLIILAKFLVRIFGLRKNNIYIYESLIIFANVSFMGFPVISALYGDAAIFPFSIINMPINILLYTYAVYLIEKGEEKDNKKFNINSIINTGVISSVLALIIFMLDIKVPIIIEKIFSMVGSATIPFSMMLIGSSLALIPIKDVFSEYKTYVLAFLKLIILPIIVYYISKIIIKDETILGFLTISAALPSASMIVMLTSGYKDKNKVAAQGVFITTIISIITLPIIAKLLL